MASSSTLTISPGTKMVLSFENLTFEVYEGDLTRQTDVEAVVCPTDRRLKHARGIAKSVSSAGGPKLNTESDLWIKNNGSLDIGDVAYTSGGDLPVKFVIYTVEPSYSNDCNSDMEIAQNLLQSIYRACFLQAKTLEVQSVVFPGVGTGPGNTVPIALSAIAAIGAISDLVNSDSVGSIKLVRFVDTNSSVVYSFTAELQKKMDFFPDGVLYTANIVDRSGSSVASSMVNGPGCKFKNETNPGHGGTTSSATDSDCEMEWEAISESRSSERCDTQAKGDGAAEEEKTCPVCMEDFDAVQSVQKLEKCGHKFHDVCIKEAFQKMQPQCPVCKVWYGVPEGNQPRNGKMTSQVQKGAYGSLPGFKESGCIVIHYSFPGGVQGKEHRRPGQGYSGTTRQAFLPNNDDGHMILKLLQKAFDHRLIFTIGDSVTSGTQNTVVWNNIHHKTNTHGGPENYGYPDPTYLMRVEEELAAVGITRDMIK